MFQIFDLFTDIVTICISFTAVIIAYSVYKQNTVTMNNQKEYYELCLRPICNIRCIQYSHSVDIIFTNDGNGYLTIEEITVTDTEQGTKFTKLFQVFPKEIVLDYYSVDICQSSVAARGHIKLVGIKNINDKEQMEKIRKILSKYEIEIKYTDAYNKENVAKKNLKEFFGKQHREA